MAFRQIYEWRLQIGVIVDDIIGWGFNVKKKNQLVGHLSKMTLTDRGEGDTTSSWFNGRTSSVSREDELGF